MRETTHDRAKDLYELLEVSPSASPHVIQAAYHVLARAWHPDVNPTPEASRRIRELNAAYELLSDPQRRARYDLQRVRSTRRDRLVSDYVGQPGAAGHAQPIIVIPATRAQEQIPLTRPLVDGRLPVYTGRLPVYSAQAFLMMATIAVLVGAMLFLLWVGMTFSEEMPLDHGAFIEITTK